MREAQGTRVKRIERGRKVRADLKTAKYTIQKLILERNEAEVERNRYRTLLEGTEDKLKSTKDDLHNWKRWANAHEAELDATGDVLRDRDRELAELREVIDGLGQTISAQKQTEMELKRQNQVWERVNRENVQAFDELKHKDLELWRSYDKANSRRIKAEMEVNELGRKLKDLEARADEVEPALVKAALQVNELKVEKAGLEAERDALVDEVAWVRKIKGNVELTAARVIKERDKALAKTKTLEEGLVAAIAGEQGRSRGLEDEIIKPEDRMDKLAQELKKE